MLALGNFDGLHRGHKKIIERVRRGAAERGGTPLVLTFDPHPPRVVRPDKAPPLLMTLAQKIEALERGRHPGRGGRALHARAVALGARDVRRAVLVDWLRVAEVWVGADFLFGRDRSGNFSLLRTLGAQYGFRAEKIDPVRYKEFVVSSTRIRRLVSEGRVDEAGALLGHHYAIDGVGRGRARGAAARSGFPTANLSTDNELVPPNGVYATTVTVDGVVLPGDHEHRRAADVRGGRAVTIETHVLGFDARPLRPRRCGWASSSGCGTSGGSPTWTRCARRSRPTCAGPAVVRQHLGVTMNRNLVRVHDADPRRPRACSAPSAIWRRTPPRTPAASRGRRPWPTRW